MASSGGDGWFSFEPKTSEPQTTYSAPLISENDGEIRYLEKYELWIGNVLPSAIRYEDGQKDFDQVLNNHVKNVLSRYIPN